MLAISAGYKDMLATLFITIVFDVKSNVTKGLVERLETEWLLGFVLNCFSPTKNLYTHKRHINSPT